MTRYQFPAFNASPWPRYVALWDLQWTLLDCLRMEPAADFSEAMVAAIERLGADRRLLMLTPRDPHATNAQSYNPFG